MSRIEPDLSSLSKEQILLTGSTGFLGQHLVRTLAGAGLLPTLVYRDATKLQASFPSYPGNTVQWDMSSPADEGVKAAISKCSVAIHLAGETYAASIPGPVQTLSSNVIPALHLMHVLPPSCRHVVFLSSASVYGSGPGDLVSEDHTANPSDMYGIAKLMLEGLLRLYGREHAKTVTNLRVSSVYGAQMPRTRAIPLFIEALLRGKPVTLTSNSSVPRNYIYVEDVSRAICLSLLAGQGAAGVFNICARRSASIEEVLEILEQLTGVAAQRSMVADPRGPASPQLYDVRRTEHALGFVESFSLAEGLAETVRSIEKTGQAQ